ncbi:Protein of unknown function [Pyronema omphalodes CBS 100304]|uniref:Uncharacterized protein n=1 Tax=Pyronema omphalodes (strain CBS 100304) TaxID=1076935 RepID=U4LCU8_PYROM|nr:Protein of unknown function [Pyronema omphalodes CBS 100304]
MAYRKSTQDLEAQRLIPVNTQQRQPSYNTASAQGPRQNNYLVPNGIAGQTMRQPLYKAGNIAAMPGHHIPQQGSQPVARPVLPVAPGGYQSQPPQARLSTNQAPGLVNPNTTNPRSTKGTSKFQRILLTIILMLVVAALSIVGTQLSEEHLGHEMTLKIWTIPGWAVVYKIVSWGLYRLVRGRQSAEQILHASDERATMPLQWYKSQKRAMVDIEALNTCMRRDRVGYWTMNFVRRRYRIEVR